MDFDLFEQDDDDDILTTIALEPTQYEQNCTTVAHEVIPEFQCSGEDSKKSQFSNDSFIKNNFIINFNLQNKHLLEELTLTGYDFQIKHLNGNSVRKFIYGEVCMNIQYLMASVRGPIGVYDELSFYQRRRQVTQFYYLLLHTTEQLQWPLIRLDVQKIRNLLNRISDSETWKTIYFANSNKGNECNIPAYHLLHGLLEWKLLDLFILYKYDMNNHGNDDKHQTVDDEKTNVSFWQQLDCIFDDLIVCSLYLYGKKHSTDLLYQSPFPCTCFKEFWLILQLTLPQWSAEQMPENANKIQFWTLFNKAMMNVKNKMAQFSLTPLSYCEFTNWLLSSLTRLHGYRSNGQYEGPNYVRATMENAENNEFTEHCVQQFLNANPNEEQLRIFICLLSPMLLQWCRPKVNMPMLLWESFHKKLNNAFYVAGAAPSNLAVACSTGRAYIEKYRQLLAKEEPDGNLTSYTQFTLFLGKMLVALLKSNQQHQVQKLLGRIYSKFSAQKFLALNETGIHHIIELFLVLAMCGDFNDLAPKLRDKLLMIGLDKVTNNKQVAVTKGHIALLILHAEQHCDISDYVQKLLQQLSVVRNDLAVSKVIANGLLDIFEHALDFRHGERLLIDAWLPNFLNNCTPAEQERSLDALHLIFIKLQGSGFVVDDDAHGELLQALQTHILPFLKQQYACNFSHSLPQLAADFCIYTCNSTDTTSFQRLFSYFIEAQTANRQALPQFLLKIMESEKSNLVEDTVVMHVWLKSLVLLTAVNEQVASLTKHVVQLPLFAYMTSLEPSDLLTAKEPLCVFIAALGKQYDACVEYERRCRLADNLNAYLRNFEKWVQAELKHEKSELAFRFYSFLAIVIYNCPQIVYVKSKITCFFHIAMTRFILPTNIQMGKPPDVKLAQLIHKIWPVLVQGIGKLNFKTDSYINKTLTDLIQKWTPHFKVSHNSKIVARPFIACVQCDNPELTLFIFEKLTNMFLAIQRRQADPNACLVVTIFQEIVEAIGNGSVDAINTQRLLIFMKGSCLLTLEHIMMVDEVVPSRGMLLEFFKRLILSPVYQASNELQSLLAEHLRILTKKHLAYYTFFFFELLMKLTQISHMLIMEIMDFLMNEVRIVEAKRGAGEDNRIRSCLQKLQQAVENAKQKCR